MKCTKMVPYGILAAGILHLSATPGEAFSPASAKRHDVFSPSGCFVVDVDPKTKMLTVYGTADRATPLWSFSRAIHSQKVFLSSDGQIVAIVAWKYCWSRNSAQDCIEFWSKAGKVKSYTFSEICPRPRYKGFFESGPVGWGSCVWYDDPIQQEDNVLDVRTTGYHDATFSLEDGTILSQEFAWRNVRGFALLLACIVVLCLAFSSCRRQIARGRRLAAIESSRVRPS